MVEIKTYISEWIKQEDVIKGESAVIRTEPYIDDESEYDSLVAEVDYCGMKKKVSINKGNARRLSEAWGTETKKWIQREIIIKIPETTEEKKSRSTLIIVPKIVETISIPEIKSKEQRKKELIERGVKPEMIEELESIGAL